MPGWDKPGFKATGWETAIRAEDNGIIRSAWKRDAARFEFAVTVPANTTASVFLPAKSAESVMESGQPLAQAQGVKFLRLDHGRATLSLESGSFRFVSLP